MGSKDIIVELRDSLRMVNGFCPTEKITGLRVLDDILSRNDKRLNDYGYDLVLLNELMKLLKFEEGIYLETTLNILERYYFKIFKHQDDIMEGLLHRYGLSTNHEVCMQCLEKISTLIDYTSDNIAKHSKQLLRLTDISLNRDANRKVEEILMKLRPKLPKRKLFNH